MLDVFKGCNSLKYHFLLWVDFIYCIYAMNINDTFCLFVDLTDGVDGLV